MAKRKTRRVETQRVWVGLCRVLTILLCGDLIISGKSGAVILPNGGDSMTIMEVFALLNLLAVVIFGVIAVTKKK